MLFDYAPPTLGSDTASIYEWLLFSAALIGVLLHLIGVFITFRDVSRMAKLRLPDSAIRLAKGHRRTEFGRLHLKTALLLGASFALTLPPSTGRPLAADIVTIFLALGALHLNINAIEDFLDRRRIIRTEVALRTAAMASGRWDGVERRRAI